MRSTVDLAFAAPFLDRRAWRSEQDGIGGRRALRSDLVEAIEAFCAGGGALAELVARVDASCVGLVGQAARFTPNRHTAMRLIARHARVIDEALTCWIESGPDGAVLHMAWLGPRAPAYEALSVALMARGLTRWASDGAPALVPHPRFALVDIAAVGDAPRGDRGGTAALTCDSSSLIAPLHADAAVAETLARMLQLTEERLRRVPATLWDIHWAMVRQLPHHAPSVESIARECGTSPRSLQRRLLQHGTTFRALIDDVRRDVALEQLSIRGNEPR